MELLDRTTPNWEEVEAMGTDYTVGWVEGVGLVCFKKFERMEERVGGEYSIFEELVDDGKPKGPETIPYAPYPAI